MKLVKSCNIEHDAEKSLHTSLTRENQAFKDTHKLYCEVLPAKTIRLDNTIIDMVVLWQKYISGPVYSRRLGRSLGDLVEEAYEEFKIHNSRGSGSTRSECYSNSRSR